MEESFASSFTASQRSVLVTGCSSGIGRATALGLARAGYTVFATVRTEAHATELRGLGIPDLVPLCPLDLTHLEHIPPVMARVEAELAHAARPACTPWCTTPGAARWPHRTAEPGALSPRAGDPPAGVGGPDQACLPLIRSAHGRLVWIVTPAIIPTPYVASIHACDFAVNCIARTLEIELKPWDIPNIMIRCGGIKTAAGLRTTGEVAALFAAAPPERLELYRPALSRWGEDMAAFDEKRAEPAAVAALVLKALEAQASQTPLFYRPHGRHGGRVGGAAPASGGRRAQAALLNGGWEKGLCAG
jgi:NAD(P)-dependent dehydrogenase (short-subunit alcohol dehydrogenase family)